MNQSLFNLTQLPERSSKPRNNGLTMVMDKGLSLREVENFLENGEQYTDIIKLGFGTSYFTPKIQEKIKLYQSVNIPVSVSYTHLTLPTNREV